MSRLKGFKIFEIKDFMTFYNRLLYNSPDGSGNTFWHGWIICSWIDLPKRLE